MCLFLLVNSAFTLVSSFIACHTAPCACVSCKKKGISHFSFWKTTHACGSHHNLTSGSLATDTVENTEVHVYTLQPCSLRKHGFGCIDVCTPITGCEPKTRSNGSQGLHSTFTDQESNDVRRPYNCFGILQWRKVNPSCRRECQYGEISCSHRVVWPRRY